MIGSSLKKAWSRAVKPYSKILLSVACVIVLGLVLVAFSAFQQELEVNVYLDGHEWQVTTQATTVQELLQELNIVYSEHDEIIPQLDVELEAEMNIIWNKAKQISFINLGEHQSVWTTAQTVGEFVQEQGIDPEGEEIEVTPYPHVRIDSNQWVEVAHVYDTIEEEEFTVEHQIVRREDSSMLQGQEKVAVEGQDGKGLNRYKVTYKNGFEVGREKVETEILEAKRDQIVAVGTIASVSRGGYVFAPRQVLEDVTLTAYAAGESHTGKTPDHPQYGITSSGSRAEEGRTIAVDPNVIPIGTWVYIEDIGLRRAEDTGGAVKGNKIDIYFEEDSAATSFGTKKNSKVYVIGKTKPSSQ